MLYYSVTASALNIRPRPSTKKPPVGTLARGSLWLGTGETSGDWVAGKSLSAVSGWVSKGFIAPAPSLAPTTEVRESLTTLGWRTDTDQRVVQSIRDFQAMYSLSGAPLQVTGVTGPADIAALREAVRLGRISAHFAPDEFRCKCQGKYKDCRRIRVPRATVLAAEKLRTLIGGFTPLSTYRCPGRNDHVGGYERSQHLYGLAMDIPPTLTPTQLRPLGVFSGFGVQSSTGKVRHVDLRHLSPDNFPRATLKEPRVYTYG